MRLRKDVNVYLYDPSKKYFQIVIELENVPGALHNVLDVMLELRLNVLGSFSSVESAARVGVWSGFVEDNDHSAGELKRKLSSSAYVHDVMVVESSRGFLVDGIHFPLAFNTGTRAVMMTAKALAKMLGAVRTRYGSGGNFILYEEGRSYGKDIAGEYLVKLGADFVVSNIAEVLKLYQALGWFRVEGVKADVKGGNVTIRALDSFECVGGEARVPLSQFVRGHLEGALTTWLGREMECEEKHCIATGEKYCEFVLHPKGSSKSG